MPRRRTDGNDMRRFGGRPYFDGDRWRCPDCNGLAEKDGFDYGRRRCATCGRYGEVDTERFGWFTLARAGL